MHQPLRILDGRILDPQQHGQTEQRDIYIADGKIVAALPPDTASQTLDATGLIVMPGGIDMHTHIASTPVNAARAMCSLLGIRHKQQPLVPSTLETGRTYARLGYTTAIEAAVAPADVPAAHLQLEDTPHLDTGLLVLMDNHDLILDLLDRGDEKGADAVVQHLLARCGGYGIKAVNPTGVAAWRRDARCHDIQTLDDPVPGSRLTPRRLLLWLSGVADRLNLPHPLHLHANRLGKPGNVQMLEQTLETLAGRRLHLAHLQFYAYGKSKTGSFTSAARQVVDMLARHPKVSADVGMVMFGPACTVTADTPLEHGLWRLTGDASRPAQFVEIENQAGSGVMPARYSRRNRIHSLQWAIGLELLLACDNPWQICLSIDHPNGGSFAHFPAIIALLMNRDLRRQWFTQIHPYAREHSTLGDIAREMTLEEIAILTRSGPAKMLGLSQKGTLQIGADADLALYSSDMSDPARTFAQCRHVIQAGRWIVRDGRLGPDVAGRRLRADVAPNSEGNNHLEHWRQAQDGYDGGLLGLPASMLARMKSIQGTVK